MPERELGLLKIPMRRNLARALLVGLKRMQVQIAFCILLSANPVHQGLKKEIRVGENIGQIQLALSPSERSRYAESVQARAALGWRGPSRIFPMILPPNLASPGQALDKPWTRLSEKAVCRILWMEKLFRDR